MALLEIFAILLALTALFGFINQRFLKFPDSIGLLVIGLASSGIIIGVDSLWPRFEIAASVRDVLDDIDFHDALMEGFLSALLFAGAVHIDLTEIAARKWAITLMATLGVLISTFLVGTFIWFAALWMEFHLPFIWALVFGALISPTDPVAVLGILKRVRVPKLLAAKIAGESLFNDGVGVVVFTIMLALAMGGGPDGGNIGLLDVASLFFVEAVGGAVLGLICGLVAFRLMASLDEHNLEIIITLALVTGAYALALRMHVSGPIAMVVAGLLIGNHGARLAMSENTREHVFQFWALTDEILNSVLFLLIGLEVLVIRPSPEFAWLAVAAIPIMLVARWVAVSIPIGLMSFRERFTEGAIRILTWGGLRGGISVALALSLPQTAYKAPILTATYGAVIFSIVVQGLTMEPLVRRIISDGGSSQSPEHD